MSSRSALSVVEQQYGSLEELAYHILENKREALNESEPLAVRAESVGLPMLVFARILQDPMFRQLLRADLVNTSYGLTEEEHHIKAMVKVAMNEPRTVVTNKGNVAEVDQMPTDIIAAGKYLNEMRGTPVQGKKDSAFNGVVVNFENVTVNVGGHDASEPITLEAEVHRPRRAGDLPSEAVPSRSRASVQLPAASSQADDVGLGTFYGDGAREADEAHALTAKREGREEEPEMKQSLWPGPVRRRDMRTSHRRDYRQKLAQRPEYDD